MKKVILPIFIAVVALTVIFGVIKAVNKNSSKDSSDRKETVESEESIVL